MSRNYLGRHPPARETVTSVAIMGHMTISQKNHEPFRAVLFDLDDTLYDRNAAFAGWADDYLRQTCGVTDKAERQLVLTRIAAVDACGYGSKKSRARGTLPPLPAPRRGGRGRDVIL